MIVNDYVKELLDRYEWDIECESPLEIRNEESNSFASNWAAEMVIETLNRRYRYAQEERLYIPKTRKPVKPKTSKTTRRIKSMVREIDMELLEQANLASKPIKKPRRKK